MVSLHCGAVPFEVHLQEVTADLISNDGSQKHHLSLVSMLWLSSQIGVQNQKAATSKYFLNCSIELLEDLSAHQGSAKLARAACLPVLQMLIPFRHTFKLYLG